MPSRRGHNEGSIYQRASDHRWTGAITLSNGSRRVLYGKTKREVRDKLVQAQALDREGQWVATRRQTLEAYLTAWLAHKSLSIRPMTVVAYQLSIDRVVPHIGKTRLDALRPVHIQECYDKLLREGLAGKPLSSPETRNEKREARGAATDAVRPSATKRYTQDNCLTRKGGTQ